MKFKILGLLLIVIAIIGIPFFFLDFSGQADITPIVQTGNGDVVPVTIEFTQKQTSLDGGSTEVTKKIVDNLNPETELQKGIYDIEITPEKHKIKNVVLRDVNVDGDTEKIVDIDEFTTQQFDSTYAINPEYSDFTNGTVTVIASSTHLFKCKEWEYDTRTCNGEWKLLRDDLIPGQEYTFIITPDDPGFGETNLTHADYYDNNWTFLQDITNETFPLDGVWSPKIYHDQWIRAKFDANMSNGDVFDLYVRNTNQTNVTIEIYETNTTNLLASTPRIIPEQYYYTRIKNLVTPSDTFDIKIVNLQNDTNAYLEFDHIHDAAPLSTFNGSFFEGFESAGLVTNGWNASGGTNNDWKINGNGGQKAPRTGNYNVLSKNSGPTETILETNLSTIGYTNIHVDFYYKTIKFNISDHLYFDWYDGTSWTRVFSHNDTNTGTYKNFNYTFPITATNNPNFKIRFTCLSNGTKNKCVVDDINITSTLITDLTLNNVIIPTVYDSILDVNDNITLSLSINESGLPYVNITDWQIYNGTNFNSITPLNIKVETSNGTNLKDYSTYNNSGGSIAGNVFYSPGTGRDGGATHDFGTPSASNVINIPRTSSMSSQEFTTCQWFYPTTLNSDEHLMDMTSGSNGWRMYFYNSGSILNFLVDVDGGAAYQAQWTHSLSLNAWHLACGTYDGSNTKLIVDGVQRANTAGGGTLSYTVSNLKLGQNNVFAQSSRSFEGKLDDTLIFDRALTTNQINELYNDNSLILSENTNLNETWKACATSNDGSDSNTLCSNNVTITNILPIINNTVFTGNTTDFTAETNISNVCNATLETNISTIQFNGCADFLGVDVNNNFLMQNENDITISSQNLNPTFNQSATITFQNLAWGEQPLLVQNTIKCEAPDCVLVSWDNVTKTAVYNITNVYNDYVPSDPTTFTTSKPIDFTPTILDEQGNSTNYDVNIISSYANVSIHTGNTSTTLTNTVIGTYDIEIIPNTNSTINSIYINDYELNDTQTELIDINPIIVKEELVGLAINPTPNLITLVNVTEGSFNTTTNITTNTTVEIENKTPIFKNFTTAEIEITAGAGGRLVKCTQWDFELNTCDGNWEIIAEGLIPGQNYTFNITPTDPGFYEIPITFAEVYNQTGDFREDITVDVIALDNEFTAPIYHNETIRITFNETLTNQNDIRIIAEASNITNDMRIDVYKANTTEYITSFDNISNLLLYRELLTNMTGTETQFDLKVLSNSGNTSAYIIVDHITDPLIDCSTFFTENATHFFISSGGTIACNVLAAGNKNILIQDTSFNLNINGFDFTTNKTFEWYGGAFTVARGNSPIVITANDSIIINQTLTTQGRSNQNCIISQIERYAPTYELTATNTIFVNGDLNSIGGRGYSNTVCGLKPGGNVGANILLANNITMGSLVSTSGRGDNEGGSGGGYDATNGGDNGAATINATTIINMGYVNITAKRGGNGDNVDQAGTGGRVLAPTIINAPTIEMSGINIKSGSSGSGDNSPVKPGGYAYGFEINGTTITVDNVISIITGNGASGANVGPGGPGGDILTDSFITGTTLNIGGATLKGGNAGTQFDNTCAGDGRCDGGDTSDLTITGTTITSSGDISITSGNANPGNYDLETNDNYNGGNSGLAGTLIINASSTFTTTGNTFIKSGNSGLGTKNNGGTVLKTGDLTITSPTILGLGDVYNQGGNAGGFAFCNNNFKKGGETGFINIITNNGIPSPTSNIYTQGGSSAACGSGNVNGPLSGPVTITTTTNDITLNTIQSIAGSGAGGSAQLGVNGNITVSTPGTIATNYLTGIGINGNITISSATLNFTDIGVSSINGQAGNVNINVTGDVTGTNVYSLATTGDAGTIDINAFNMVIDESVYAYDDSLTTGDVNINITDTMTFTNFPTIRDAAVQAMGNANINYYTTGDGSLIFTGYNPALLIYSYSYTGSLTKLFLVKTNNISITLNPIPPATANISITNLVDGTPVNQQIPINITLRNDGTTTRNATIKLDKEGPVTFDTIPVLNLAASETRIIQTSWNTTIETNGPHNITATLTAPTPNDGVTTLTIGVNVSNLEAPTNLTPTTGGNLYFGSNNVTWNAISNPLSHNITYDLEANTGSGFITLITGTPATLYDWVISFFYNGTLDLRVKAVDNNDSFSSPYLTSTGIQLDTSDKAVRVNETYITPTTDIRANTPLHCNFEVYNFNSTNNIDVTVTWEKTFDGVTWIPVHTYDNTFLSVTENLLITTTIGTGSVNEDLTGTWNWRCIVLATNGEYS